MTAAHPPRAGRTALVTGGSVGIGRGVAHRFVRSGMRVLVTGRDPGSLAAAQEALGADAIVLASDAGDPADIRRLREQAESTLGGLDVLVLNAGIGAPSAFGELTEERFDRTLAVNLKGPFFTAQALGDLIRPGGAIVLITSISSTMGRTGMFDYDASKAALRSLTRSLAAEFLPRDVRVNAVSLGAIRTTVLDRAGLAPEVKEQVVAQMTEMVPMKRFGDVDEIAAAVDFLAFDATFTTGAELPVDGGQSQF